MSMWPTFAGVRAGMRPVSAEGSTAALAASLASSFADVPRRFRRVVDSHGSRRLQLLLLAFQLSLLLIRASCLRCESGADLR